MHTSKRGLAFLWGIIFSIIIVITSFAILSYTILSVDTNSFTIDQICKLSVLTRATTPDIADRLLQFPIKCTTKKICISQAGFLGGGNTNCEQFANEDELVSVGIDTSGSPSAEARKIEKTIADEMLSCWKTLGEGKLDLVNEANKKGAQCIICSRIGLSRELRSHGDYQEIMSQVNVNQYLQETEAPQQGKTYIEVFAGDNVQASDELNKGILETAGTGADTTNEVAILFGQVKTELTSQDAALQGAGFLLAGGTAIGAATGTVKFIATKVGFLATAATIGIGYGVSFAQQYEARTISAAYCGKFASGRGDKIKGCSIVTAVDYSEVDKINELCPGGILGNP